MLLPQLCRVSPLGLSLAFSLIGLTPAVIAQQPASAPSFLVANNDEGSVTFYNLGADGTPVRSSAVLTGGTGIRGGSFAVSRVIVLQTADDLCVFASDAGTSDVAGIEAKTRTVTGNFLASATDLGNTNGIGLAANASYLYAAYSTSSTIATFQVQSGCKLNFVSDLFSAGLSNGWVTGMAIHGALMVVTYGDGSIGSFNIAAGSPVANNDQQYSTGYSEDHVPGGVQITADGHFALFGDASTVGTVEVSDISGGMLKPTIPYKFGYGWNSGVVRLSPDETTLYVSNDSSGQVTAASFNKTTGAVNFGCTSGTLSGFYTNWGYGGNIGLQLTSGTGGLLYLPEYGPNGTSTIGIVQFAAGSSGCTLTEAPNSPVENPVDLSALLSIAVYPARP